MKLLEYLKNNFSSFSLEELQNNFMEKFGVNVKNEGDLYLFKYGQIEAKWSESITYECRGTILEFKNNDWKIISRPFEKFFNQHESKCPLHDEKVFNENIPNLEIREKLDGTCIQVYYYNNDWQISTLGTIHTANVNDNNITFKELFLKQVDIEKLFSTLEIGCTYIFELCSVLNRVVTRYPTDRVYLLGVINNETGEVYSFESCTYLSILNNSDILCPSIQKLSNLNLKTLDDVNEWIEKESSNTDLYGEYPEGFVLYKDNKPICKMKNLKYITLHYSLSDPACTVKSVIHSFFKSKLDDLYDALPDIHKEFADKLGDKVREISKSINEIVSTIRYEKFKTPKDYALFINSLEKDMNQYRSFFFSNREIIENDNKYGNEIFLEWLTDKNKMGKYNYEHFMDYWKSINNE